MRAANAWKFGAVALAAATASEPAHAQSAQADVNATVTVVPSCTISATDLDFGNPAPGTTSINATSQLTVRCTQLAVFFISMDRGDYRAGQQRRMRGTTGDFVNYAIYRNAARTQDWGNTLLTRQLGLALPLTPANFTAYGRIPTLNVATLQGSYRDTVTVTLDF